MNARKMAAMAVAVILAVAGGMARAEAITHDSTTINMDFITVPDWGPADDTTYGEVFYEYNIGKYEVTADQWAAVIAADPAVGNAGSWTGSQPTGGTSWDEAAKFCNWLTTGNATSGYYTISDGVASIPDGWDEWGHYDYADMNGTTYFIPTENEWYKAAYYDPAMMDYYDYPTGSDTVPTAVAGGTDADTAVFTGNGVSPMVPADVNNAGGLSAWGTMGQGGNVQEWTEAAIGTGRGIRGGAADSGDGLLASSSRPSLAPSSEFALNGFRVASVSQAPLVGDADGDGVCDFIDYGILAAHFGGAPGTEGNGGDFNGDGMVTIDDYEVLRCSYYGYSEHLGQYSGLPLDSALSLRVDADGELSIVWHEDASLDGYSICSADGLLIVTSGDPEDFLMIASVEFAAASPDAPIDGIAGQTLSLGAEFTGLDTSDLTFLYSTGQGAVEGLVIPEPATLSLLALGGLGLLRRRRTLGRRG